MNLKLKIITGFREDQEYTIDQEEAHKAYSLFLQPELRGVFQNGLAIKGTDIQRIVPDYHSTMGWNKTYKMDEYDWAELREKGIEKRMKDLMYEAQTLARIPSSLNKPISEAKLLLLNK